MQEFPVRTTNEIFEVTTRRMLKQIRVRACKLLYERVTKTGLFSRGDSFVQFYGYRTRELANLETRFKFLQFISPFKTKPCGMIEVVGRVVEKYACNAK